MIFPKSIFHVLCWILLVGHVLGLPVLAPRSRNPLSSGALEARAPELDIRDLAAVVALLETREPLGVELLDERSPVPAEGGEKKPIRQLPTPPPPPARPPQVNAVAGGSGIQRNQYGEITDPELKFYPGKKIYKRPTQSPAGPRTPRGRSTSPVGGQGGPGSPNPNPPNQQQQQAPVAQTQKRPRGPSPQGPRKKAKA